MNFWEISTGSVLQEAMDELGGSNSRESVCVVSANGLLCPFDLGPPIAGCLCSPPRFGGEIDYSPLRWCMLIGIDCLAYAVPYSVNSRAAEVYLLTNRLCWRPLFHTSSLPTMMDALCCSQVRRSGQSGTTQCTAAIN